MFNPSVIWNDSFANAIVSINHLNCNFKDVWRDYFGPVMVASESAEFMLMPMIEYSRAFSPTPEKKLTVRGNEFGEEWTFHTYLSNKTGCTLYVDVLFEGKLINDYHISLSN
tara:strand:- start:7620 stop:7955 length:336 start_codon:yes stop_codon:yes gene_type:complete